MRQILRRHYARSEVHVPRIQRGAANTAYLAYLRGEGEVPAQSLSIRRSERQMARFFDLPQDAQDRVRLLMGHFWFGIHDLLPGSTFFTMLRDPVERVLSLYHHRATRHDLGQTVEEYLAAGRDSEIDNNQTRRLAGEDLRWSECDERTFETAKRNLVDHFPVFGLIERYDETLVLLRHHYGFNRIEYRPQNVGSGRPRRGDLAPDVLESLLQRNRWDVELHRFALELFDERTNAIPGFARSVDRFRRRNTVMGPVRTAMDGLRPRLAPMKQRVRGLVGSRRG